MIFNSIDFVFFFIIVTGVFFLIPQAYRWVLLLAASCYFYMAFVPAYILILAFTIFIDYSAGIFIARSRGKKRKRWLVCSLVANISVLCFFKYYNFFNEVLTDLLGKFSYDNPIPYLGILLPLGLSFHTFQAMSYTIEVYRGNQKPERHFGIYALYVMFYPQLVAGPIERPQNMLHQFHEPRHFNYNRVVEGLRIMLWGFIKKLVVADRLAIYVNAIYGNPQHHSGISMIVATFFFIFQIYCDFSGYSDIAIGAARVMGYDLMLNFRRPFCSKSVQEVWRRWHISLTTWFRDYLYFPLGGSRKGVLIMIRNIIIVLAISGLWHGAAGTFVIWGLMNGVALALELALNPLLRRIHGVLGITKNFFRRLGTLCVFVAVGVFFRSPNLHEAFYIFRNMIFLKQGGLFKGEPPTNFYYGLFAVGFLLTVEYTEELYPNFKIIAHNNAVIRYSGYTILVLMLLMIGMFRGNDFIYFQF